MFHFENPVYTYIVYLLYMYTYTVYRIVEDMLFTTKAI